MQKHRAIERRGTLNYWISSKTTVRSTIRNLQQTGLQELSKDTVPKVAKATCSIKSSTKNLLPSKKYHNPLIKGDICHWGQSSFLGKWKVLHCRTENIRYSYLIKIDKHRINIRLTSPYRAERKSTANQQADQMYSCTQKQNFLFYHIFN